jgi:hypothetical protein
MLLGLILAVISVPYLGRGFHQLFADSQDLHRRWTECRFILHGQDPFQLYLHHMQGTDPARNQRECERLAAIYGIPDQPVYPPWSYGPMLLLVWPAQSFVPYYYGLLNVAAIAVLIAGMLWIANPTARIEKIVVGISTLAIASICTSLVNGNFAPIIIAALILSLWLDEKGWAIPSGIFFWIALIKPTIALPFAIVFLFKRRWQSPAVAVVLAGVSCLFPWCLTHVNPMVMMHEAVTASRDFQFGGYGVVNYLAELGLPARMTTPVAGLIMLIPASVFFLFNRNLPEWKSLAVLAVIARFWAYHLAHDNVMLLFLLAASWRIFLIQSTTGTTALLLLVGASLWAPSRWAMHEWVGIVHHAIWLVATIYIICWNPRNTRDESSQAIAPQGPVIVPHTSTRG